MPDTGYANLEEAKTHIVNYLIGYYAMLRPHQKNNGISPNQKEMMYQKVH
jgi:putative transposase